MNAKTIYNIRTQEPAGISITGNYSGTAICAMNELVAALGGIEPTFHEIKRLQNNQLLPRMGGVGKPLTMRDLQLARDNEQRGERYWQWRSITRGRTYFYGYGHVDGNAFVFVNSDGSVFDRVGL
jgi:hypothetical protein